MVATSIARVPPSISTGPFNCEVPVTVRLLPIVALPLVEKAPVIEAPPPPTVRPPVLIVRPPVKVPPVSGRPPRLASAAAAVVAAVPPLAIATGTVRLRVPGAVPTRLSPVPTFQFGPGGPAGPAGPVTPAGPAGPVPPGGPAGPAVLP